MATRSVITIFHDHFAEFVDDIQRVFPEDPDILTAQKALGTVRKANPRLLVNIWIKYVANPYSREIEAGDIHFFINKDYTNDLTSANNADKIMESINRLRDPIRRMTNDEQKNTMKYIQNLSKLALMV